MNPQICVIILSAVMLCSHAELTEEVETRLKQQLNECKTTEGASDDDVSHFLAGNAAPTSKGKCLVSCMQEAFGLVKGGEVQPEGAKTAAQMMFGNDPNLMSILEKIGAKCIPISDPDRCELSFKRMSCAREAAKELGLNVPRIFI